jgi:hypothetical protein
LLGFFEGITLVMTSKQLPEFLVYKKLDY